MNKDSQKPFFSVIIPTYNQDQYLGLALDSLLEQTFGDWEAVVVNDGSTDKTKDVMEDYAHRDKRIKCFNKENGGVATALNEGIKNASGDWICWLSSDDLFVKEKLMLHKNYIKNNPKHKFFHSHWYLLLHESNQLLEPDLWLPIPKDSYRVSRFLLANYVHGNAICVHHSVFDQVGGFDGALRQGQDFDMWMRISAKYPSVFIPARTCITRLHSDQTTNSFNAGGVFDSSKSIVNFLNKTRFPEIFPALDLRKFNDALVALVETVFLSAKPNAFMYSLCHAPLLINRAKEWLANECPTEIKSNLVTHIKHYIERTLENPVPEDLKQNILSLLDFDGYVYSEYNLLGDVTNYINDLLSIGDQQKVIDLEKYLVKNYTDVFNYTPKIFNSNNSSSHSSKASNFLSWRASPGLIDQNQVSHKILFKCNNCDNKFNYITNQEYGVEPQTFKVTCPECKTVYRVTEENYSSYLTNHMFLDESRKETKSLVAFYVKDTSSIGGGTKVIFQHIEWLLQLNIEVAVYSKTSKPAWINDKINYFEIESFDENVLKSVKKLFVFSIWDVPQLLEVFPINDIVLFCQGYEGYHYGRSKEEMLTDKYIFNLLHGLPFEVVVVSTHLKSLFKKLFNKDSYYIPNSVDHSIFFPDAQITNPNRSVLFIGNPYHQLKGFDFLVGSLKHLKENFYKNVDVTLHVVVGFELMSEEEVIEKMEDVTGCVIKIHTKLSSSQVAKLINSVNVVVTPSWYEGFGLPILEAMACATPVISTRNMGAESFCVSNENANLVDYGSYHHLVNKLYNIFENGQTYAKQLINGLFTSFEYSQQNSVRAFQSEYENLLNCKFDEDSIGIFTKAFELNKRSLLKACQQKLNGSLNGFNLSEKAQYQPNLTSIILVTFNQVDYTLECIESIKKYSSRPYELIAVDNASTDNTVEQLKNNHAIKIIENKTNVGFPKAVNQGILEASGEYILLLNNDTLLTDGWLERMVEVIESADNYGIVGPISNSVSGVQLDESAKYDSIESMYKYASIISEKNKGKVDEFPRVAFLCTLIKKEVIDKIGGLDERFSPGNFEDDDFCLRAQLAGYKTVIAKDVFIHHFGSVSFKANGNDKYLERLEINKQKFVSKWGADPEEIWLQGKSIRKRSCVYPLNNDRNLPLKRALVELEAQDYDLTLEYLEQVHSNYSPEVYSDISLDNLMNLMANTALMNNNLEKAQKYFEEELNINPESSRACFGLSQVFYNADMLQESKAMCEYAIANDEHNEEANRSLIELNSKLNLHEEHNSLVLGQTHG